MYEINVAKKIEGQTNIHNDFKYEHFFATHKRSAVSRDKVELLVKEFKNKFPFPEYEITVSVSLGSKYITEEFK